MAGTTRWTVRAEIALRMPMYVEGGWKPPQEPPSRKPRFTKRQEQVFVGIIAVNALFLLIAPIGGATVIHAVLAMLGYG